MAGDCMVWIHSIAAVSTSPGWIKTLFWMDHSFVCLLPDGNVVWHTRILICANRLQQRWWVWFQSPWPTIDLQHNLQPCFILEVRKAWDDWWKSWFIFCIIHAPLQIHPKGNWPLSERYCNQTVPSHLAWTAISQSKFSSFPWKWPLLRNENAEGLLHQLLCCQWSASKQYLTLKMLFQLLADYSQCKQLLGNHCSCHTHYPMQDKSHEYWWSASGDCQECWPMCHPIWLQTPTTPDRVPNDQTSFWDYGMLSIWFSFPLAPCILFH